MPRAVWNENAAWYYPHPLPAARKVRDRVAFWRGVQVETDDARVGESST